MTLNGYLERYWYWYIDIHMNDIQLYDSDIMNFQTYIFGQILHSQKIQL